MTSVLTCVSPSIHFLHVFVFYLCWQVCSVLRCLLATGDPVNSVFICVFPFLYLLVFFFCVSFLCLCFFVLANAQGFAVFSGWVATGDPVTCFLMCFLCNCLCFCVSLQIL